MIPFGLNKILGSQTINLETDEIIDDSLIDCFGGGSGVLLPFFAFCITPCIVIAFRLIEEPITLIHQEHFLLLQFYHLLIS